MSTSKKVPTKRSIASKKASEPSSSTSDNLSIALNVFESSITPTGVMSELNEATPSTASYHAEPFSVEGSSNSAPGTFQPLICLLDH